MYVFLDVFDSLQIFIPLCTSLACCALILQPFKPKSPVGLQIIPIAFFNPVIPIPIFARSRNSDGYFWYPTSRAFFLYPQAEFQNLLFRVLRRKPYRCRYFGNVFVLFSVAVTVSTHLRVVCGHFCCPMSLGSLRDDDNENGKTSTGLAHDQQNNNFARASRFFVHFFAVVARLQRESA